MAWEGNKLTLRRLEAPVQKFVRVALPTDLERLQKHHNNILKVERERERVFFPSLHVTHILNREREREKHTQVKVVHVDN